MTTTSSDDNKNNLKVLKKGIKRILMSVLFCFLGPMVLYSSFKNTGHAFFYPVFFVGVFMCFYAVFLGYKGLKDILKVII